MAFEKYLVIRTSGALEWVDLERAPREGPVYNGTEALSNSDIRKIVDCSCLDQVHTTVPGVVMMVDDNGKLLPRPKAHNELASRLYAGWEPLRIDDIRGTVVLFALRPCNEIGELDLYPLSPAQLAAVAIKMRHDIPYPFP